MAKLAVVLSCLIAALAAFTASALADGGAGTAFVDTAQVAGSADFTSIAGGTVSPDATTVPHWSGSFAYGGSIYPYTMVGTSPLAGAATTTVKTAIVPLAVHFSGGLGGTLSGSDDLDATLASPIFQPADFSTLRNAYAPGYGYLGNQSGPPVATQYGNAVQKAMFWKTGGSTAGYDVLLARPTVYPAQQIDVPKNQGHDLVGAVSHQHFGLASQQWFSNRIASLVSSLKIPADTLPIFLADSTFLWGADPSDCCVLGYHGVVSSVNGNGKQQINTYLYASYSPQGVFSSPAIADVHALSHEVSEWYADPFANNAVPAWLAPTATHYGCTGFLETGDPVVGFGWDVPMPNGVTYHPEDEALYSWFARETPSRGFAGRYTFMQNPALAGVARGC